MPYELKYPTRSRMRAIELIKHGKYSWLNRAVNPKSVTTPKNETIRTTTGDGMLFPTIRQTPLGGLKKFKRKTALKLAKIRGDFIDVRNMSGEEATDLSKAISNIISEQKGKK